MKSYWINDLENYGIYSELTKTLCPLSLYALGRCSHCAEIMNKYRMGIVCPEVTAWKLFFYKVALLLITFTLVLFRWLYILSVLYLSRKEKQALILTKWIFRCLSFCGMSSIFFRKKLVAMRVTSFFVIWSVNCRWTRKINWIKRQLLSPKVKTEKDELYIIRVLRK